jgi:4-amino-4-deoxy-L-arabinose transferase-like glycosyltransferase
MNTVARPSRQWVTLAALVVAALALALLLHLPKRSPGYMDAYYHLTMAERIAGGQGFTEPFVWNYLDAPEDIPHPSHLYWAPLPSILAAGAIRLFGDSYAAASLPFILCAAALPLLTFGLARQMGADTREAAVSALLTLLAGFYAAYWTSPDSFAPFAVAGCGALWLMSRAHERRWRALGAGLCAGLGHLARPDGVLLILVGMLGLLWAGARGIMGRRAASRAALWMLVGYAAVMGPWFARNWAVAGSPLAGGGLSALFLRDYDELYAARHIPTLADYLSWGFASIVASKASALVSNLITLVGALLVVLVGPSAWGLWAARRRICLWPAMAFGTLLLLAMSFAFTFPGVRGSFFHSAGALVPFLFAAVFPGLRAGVAWAGARRPSWNAGQAYRVFAVALVAMAVAVSGVLYARAIGGRPPAVAPWNLRDDVYPVVARWLDAHAEAADRVMVGDPPAFYYYARRECVAIPSDGMEALRFAQAKYGVRWLVLEYNHPRFLNAIYNKSETPPGWVLRQVFYDALGEKVVLYEMAEGER